MMKKFTNKLSIVLCVLFLGMSITLPVSGQTNETVTATKKGFFEKMHQQNRAENPSPKSEGYPPVYKSTNNTYPQEIHHYYWDVTTIWMADYNRFVTYDDHANILTEIQVYANTGDTLGRLVNTYDTEGRMVERLTQNWVNGDWQNHYRQVYTYDDHGNQNVNLVQMWQYSNWETTNGYKRTYTYDMNDNITEVLWQLWNTGITAWENYWRDFYTYDSNGYLIELIDQTWNGMSWISDDKETYTNNVAGVIIEKLVEDWDDISSIWVNEAKIIDIVWHNWTGDPNESDLKSSTSLEWASGIWENDSRVNTTYDAFGGYIEIEEDYINGNWENHNKYTDSYDEHSNDLGHQEEYWTNGTWIINSGTKYLLTYSGIDLVERIYQDWDPTISVPEYVNQWKQEYSDFVTIEGIDENGILSASLILYPNPVKGILNIEIMNMDIENFSVEIVNANGQVIYFKQYDNAGQFENIIDVSSYSKGIYFVKVQNEKEAKVGKVLIQ